MPISLYVLLSVLTPFVAEAFARTHPDHPKRLRFGAYILLAATGMMSGWFTLTLIPFPLAATALNIGGYAFLVIANNAKLRVLRMGLAAQDTENLRHMLLYPDFYFVHVGIARSVCVALLAFGVLAALIMIDQPLLLIAMPDLALATWAAGLVVWLTAYALIMAVGGLIFRERRKTNYRLVGDADADMARYGLFGSFVLHRLMLRDTAPVKAAVAAAPKPMAPPKAEKPHILLVQGESFFDLARADTLALNKPAPWQAYEALKAKHSAAAGLLDVPAWGAYTMQTEMAVLTGIDRGAYGTASLNPYQAAASKMDIWSLARAAKAAGYATLCLHPAKPGFFRRDAAMRNLGFDRFLSARDFAGAERFGPYIADTALADMAEALMADSDTPLFLHLITMESHGPWDAGRLKGYADEAALLAAEPTGDLAFALFRQHMQNLLALTDRLLSASGARTRVLGLYGDHMPAHGALFDRLGFDDRRVDWLLARSDRAAMSMPATARAEDFGLEVMRAAGFDVPNSRP